MLIRYVLLFGSDLPFTTSVGYLYLLAFVFLIVVVMMNLLNGLAVSDTGVIRHEAEIYAYKCQVEIISYLEAMMLGGQAYQSFKITSKAYHLSDWSDVFY